jgi:hypothetical protein
MEAWANAHSDVELSPEIQRQIQGKLTASLSPVNPLPSQGWLVLSFIAIFAVCSALLIGVLGKAGFHLMTTAQMAGTAVIFTAGGILFAQILAWRMIPGSRPSFPVPLAMALSGLAVIGAIAALFPWRASGPFVSEGWPCAILELIIAIPATFVFWLAARRGALFASARLGATITGLAVFLALVPLQTQCMFQQAPHLLFWHGGAAAAAVGLGGLIGKFQRHRSAF